jgi:hypothetical protein
METRVTMTIRIAAVSAACFFSMAGAHAVPPTAVTVAGSLQSEVGCGGDWMPDCAATHLAYDSSDAAWQGTFTIPAGSYEYKVAMNNSWTENYGVGGVPGGANAPLSLPASTAVKFYYDPVSHWFADNQTKVIVTAPGSYQSEIGAPGDWQPDNLRSWLQDLDGDGVYTRVIYGLPAGAYETKAAINESWTENYGLGGVPGGASIPFTQATSNRPLLFSYNPVTHVLSVAEAPPQTLVVTNTNDSGAGSLRAAVAAALPGDIVTFSPALTSGGPATITLTSGRLEIIKGITIQGPGRDLLAVSGNNASSVLNVSGAADLLVSSITLRDGTVASGQTGAGASVAANSELTMSGCRVTMCSGGYGAGLDVPGVAILVDSEVSDCAAGNNGGAVRVPPTGALFALRTAFLRNDALAMFGGAIDNDDGTVELYDCRVEDNTAPSHGGGIHSSGGVRLGGCTFARNSASRGGGVWMTTDAGPGCDVLNCTFSQNTAAEFAGAIGCGGVMPVVLLNVTVSGNTGGTGTGGVASLSLAGESKVLLANCLVAGNTGGASPDLGFVVDMVSGGYNLIGNAGNEGFGINTTGDRYGDPNNNTTPAAGAIESPFAIDPMLNPLADNGGPTPTRAPMLNSPAVDHANPATTVTVDQRGWPRPKGAGFDVGAVEVTGVAPVMDDPCTDNDLHPVGSPDGWSPFGFQNAMAWVDHSTTEGAYRGYITPNSSYHRVSGVVANPQLWLRYSDIGTTGMVRAKYYLYAAGQATPGQVNLMPNVRMRVAVRYALNSMFELFGHQNGDPAVQPLANEIAPSSDRLKPSQYRVDLDPVDVPLLATTAGEGVMRAFEAYAQDPQDNGYIAMTESVIGVYPKLLAVPAAVPPVKAYAPSASDAGDLKSGAMDAALLKYSVLTGGLGEFPTVDFGVFPVYSEGTGGVTFDSTAFNNTAGGNRVGILLREFGPGANLAQRVRVEPAKQYTVQFHVTGTQQSNRQPQLRLRARTVKFSWVQKLELGGSQAAGALNNSIATQIMPGVGCLNPDKDGTENGGWYTMVIHTPLDPDVRADKTGTIAQRMPLLTAEPGPGSNTASRRDLKLGADLLDSISFGALAPQEAGNFTVDHIRLWAVPLVTD